MADAALFVFVLLVGLAAPLVLYLFVREETSERTEMSRAEAEAYARSRADERYDSDRDHDGDREHDRPDRE